MTAGMVFAGLAWIAVGSLQLVMDGGGAVHITWQILHYALLTLGEVLVSATGLEFAYSQAPASMKGALMSFWNLTFSIGNLWVLIANAAVRNAAVTDAIKTTGFGVTAFQMFFFAGFADFEARTRGSHRRFKHPEKVGLVTVPGRPNDDLAPGTLNSSGRIYAMGSSRLSSVQSRS